MKQAIFLSNLFVSQKQTILIFVLLIIYDFSPKYIIYGDNNQQFKMTRKLQII